MIHVERESTLSVLYFVFLYNSPNAVDENRKASVSLIFAHLHIDIHIQNLGVLY